MAQRRPAPKGKPAKRLRITLKRTTLVVGLVGLLAAAAYTVHLDMTVRARFEGKRFALPARIYARPLELYPGRKLARAELSRELALLRYRQEPGAGKPGTYHWDGPSLDLVTRRFVFADGPQPATRLRVELAQGQVAGISDRATGKPLSIIRLDPPLIGGIYPEHHEDRELKRLTDAPPHLIAALLAVEDRRFYSHIGVDPKAMVRALVATVRGESLQGASTLTQQLVKNLFLTPERTLPRKLTEMVMALLLDIHYGKQEILETYLNEVYLGQDGQRAIHGFGLAASFYFDRPLDQLDIPEAALLVGMLKGPIYYGPRRNPRRALERRNFVLEQMAGQGAISSQQLRSAQAAPLGVTKKSPRGASPYPAFLDLVHRQLQRDYQEEDLRAEGLRVITTLDPVAQRSAEKALDSSLGKMERARRLQKGSLEGAVVVTSAQNAEVLALVGGRDYRYRGFNRVLDARRPIGSLIKPLVFLTALQKPRRYTLATILDDSPLTLSQPGSDDWAPQNYDHQFRGPVPLLDALVHSYNVPTVRLGLEVGVHEVMGNLRRFGVDRELPEFASSLLGAVELSPLEVTRVYQTMAGGGFRTPLRAIRTVLTTEGKPLERYPLSVEQESGGAPMFLLTTALQEVVRRGTARSLARYLPPSMGAAGKTGTTDGLRDSWFAGFTGDRVAVVWVGRDDNRPTGLTGASGAMVVWGKAMAGLDPAGLDPVQPDEVEWAWVEAASGLRSGRGCPGAVRLPFIAGSAPAQTASCGGDSVEDGLRKLGRSISDLFRGIFSE